MQSKDYANESLNSVPHAVQILIQYPLKHCKNLSSKSTYYPLLGKRYNLLNGMNLVTGTEFGLKLYETMLDVTNKIVPQHQKLIISKTDDTMGKK